MKQSFACPRLEQNLALEISKMVHELGHIQQIFNQSLVLLMIIGDVPEEPSP